MVLPTGTRSFYELNLPLLEDLTVEPVNRLRAQTEEDIFELVGSPAFLEELPDPLLTFLPLKGVLGSVHVLHGVVHASLEKAEAVVDSVCKEERPGVALGTFNLEVGHVCL
jgi:hypothetical protein